MKIKLEIPQLSDAEIMARYADNKNIWKDVTDSFPSPYTKQDAIDYINFINEQAPITTFKITNDGKFCGLISLTIKKGVYKRIAEIGYWLAEPFWGKGIMTKAAKQIIKFGFETFPDLEKIFANVYHTNNGSMRVLEKAGMKKEAVMKKQAFKAGEFKDLHFYCIFREDFK